MTKVTHATRAEGISYGIMTWAIMFMIGGVLCATGIGLLIGIPVIAVSFWHLFTSPWKYRKILAGDCPVCSERCIMPPKVRARKCPCCKSRLVVRGDELCKV